MKNTNSVARNLNTIISRTNPLIFVAIYVFVIFSFAELYRLQFCELYAPYTKFEESTQDDANNMANIIEKGINKKTNYSSRTVLNEGKNYNIDSVDVSSHFISQETDSNILNFTIISGITASKNKGWFQIVFPMSINEKSGVAEATTDGNGRHFHYVNIDAEKVMVFSKENIDEKDIDKNLIEEILLRMFHYDTLDYVTPSARAVQITADEDVSYSKLFDGINGNPVSVNNNYSRMVYFSIAVITTLGFGDIVPINSGARLLVSIEAIFGIMLFGLFINAIAYRAGKGST